MKYRVFRYLVREKGFRTFALEAPWSTRQRLDAYVLRGEGDPRQIMREEFQESYRLWNNREYRGRRRRDVPAVHRGPRRPGQQRTHPGPGAPP